MQHYQNYQTTDFVLDPDFQQWVRKPTEQSDAHWQNVRLLFPHQEQTMEDARQILLSIKSGQLDREDIPEEKMLANILDRIHDDRVRRENVHTERILPQHNKYRIRRPIWVGIAASATLLLATFLTYYTWHNYQYVEVATTYGEVQEIWLPDSSQIMLNANSSIRYRNDWTEGGVREIWLDGEAYFRVQKQKHLTQGGLKQFVVHADELDIEVLGTEFNVYRRHETTEVALAEGKVQVNLDRADSAERIMMKPGDLLTYSVPQKSLVTATVDPVARSAWQHQQLVFDGEPLGEVAQRLEEFFGYEIIFQNPDFANNRFHGAVPLNDLDALISVLEKAYRITIKRNEEQLIFSEKSSDSF